MRFPGGFEKKSGNLPTNVKGHGGAFWLVFFSFHNHFSKPKIFLLIFNHTQTKYKFNKFIIS